QGRTELLVVARREPEARPRDGLLQPLAAALEGSDLLGELQQAVLGLAERQVGQRVEPREDRRVTLSGRDGGLDRVPPRSLDSRWRELPQDLRLGGQQRRRGARLSFDEPGQLRSAR